MASLFHMYDLVRSEPGAAAAAAAEASARAARAARVAAAAASAREEAAVLCNYMPLVREALRDAGVPYDEEALDPSSPLNAAAPSKAAAADAAAANGAGSGGDDDDDFVYDVYCLDPEDGEARGEGVGEGGDPFAGDEDAVTVHVREPDADGAWLVAEPGGAAGGGWGGGGSSDEDGAEVDYPDESDSDADVISGSEASDGSGGAAFLRAAESRWRGTRADSDDDDDEDEGRGAGGARRGRRLRDPYASDDEEYDTVAYEAEEEAAWAPRL